jgi:tetratricopeptide (TPR) repeat protein
MDDLQWADSSSLTLLHYLARNTKENKTLILGTYRPEDIMESQDGKTHQLETALQNMNREDLLEKIELERLGQPDTEKFIESTLGKVSFEKGFLDKVYKETEGTPFFLLEVVKLLVEDGTIARGEEDIWKLVTDIDKFDVPSKVYDVVNRRLDRLMKVQREILECASVVGEEFESEIVGNVVDLNKLQLLKNLNEIEKIHRLIHYLKDRYRFDHSKVKEVLYHGIGEELRKEYHRMVGDTIADLHKDNPDEVVSELAYHYYEGRAEKAVECLIKAGDQAKERYANQEAIRFYENALELNGVAERSGAMEQLGDVLALIGEYERAIDNYEKAKESTEDNEIKARMLRKINNVYRNRGDYDKSLEVLSKAKAIIKEEKTAETGRICMGEGYVYWKMGEYDSAMPLFLEALEIFEEFKGEQRDLGNALRAVGNIHLSKGEYDSSLQYQEKSLKVMEEIGEQYGIATALNNIGNVYIDKGDLTKALEYYEQSLEIFQKLGDKWGIAGSLNNIGNVYYYKDELAKALEHYELSLEIRQKLGDKSGIALSLGNIGNMYYDKGDLTKALGYYEQSLEIRQKLGDKSSIAFSLYNIGNVYYCNDELDMALEYLGQSLEVCLETGDKRLSAHNYCGLAETNLKLGKTGSALEHVEKAVEISVEVGVKTEEGISHRVLGMVHRDMNDWERAAAEFKKARTILEEVGIRNELARLFYEYGLMWREKEEPGKAKDYLEKALSVFEEMGMRLWAEKCRNASEEL